MTILLRLDTSAVASLFADPQAKVDLQQAVIAEIVRRTFDNYVPKDIASVVTGLFAQHRLDLIDAVRNNKATSERMEEMLSKEIANIKRDTFARSITANLKPEVKKELDDRVKLQAQNILKEAGLQGEQLIQAAAEAAFTRLNERAMNNIDHRIDQAIDKITNAEIDRRVLERLNKAMAS